MIIKEVGMLDNPTKMEHLMDIIVLWLAAGAAIALFVYLLTLQRYIAK